MTFFPPLDAARSLRISAEITRTCRLLRRSYLQGRREQLLAVYQGYKTRPDQPLSRPDTDAVLVGFEDDWVRRDYNGIVLVGDRIGPGDFRDNREAEAYYLAARSHLGPPSSGPGTL